MSAKKTHRYSFLILPIIYLIDSLFIYYLVSQMQFPNILISFLIFDVIWFFISYFTKFYEVYRNTKPAEIISKTIKQLVIFDLSVVALIHLSSITLSNGFLLTQLAILNAVLLLFKLTVYVLLKYYRAKGGNIRTYLIVGYNEETINFKKILDTRVDYGYKFDSFFGNSSSRDVLGDYDALIPYLNQHLVDVIFCSLKECSDEQIQDIIKFADNHFISVKFIPDNKEILGKDLKIDYFDYFPVLSLNKSPLNKPVNQIIKRIFDIIFSLVIIATVLWWLAPLVGLIIKIESKGPIFFTQKRNGINYHPFSCLKFRSMRPNSLADIQQVSKNDNRITKFGKFLRKSSIDELPQFFNVLKGDMSVVGPRPHMINENERLIKRADKFMARHYVKPGITGLAQVKGYRGEIKTDEDIRNRVKYDLFYIENWSLWLDLKIIFLTVYNVIRGDEKAY
jgi:putative colanic acid biosynthesis UDP-glucose lipid carrier transferase